MGNILEGMITPYLQRGKCEGRVPMSKIIEANCRGNLSMSNSSHLLSQKSHPVPVVVRRICRSTIVVLLRIMGKQRAVLRRYC